MDLDRLEVEIRHVEGDISSIGIEVDALEQERQLLLKQVQLLERDFPESIDVQEKIYDSNIPPIMKHNHFDNSIREFFNVEPKSNKRDFGSLDRVDTVGLKENILYENIFRIGGVTAFPLNRYLFDDDDCVLGLRFDTFSSSQGKFLTPHYVILRQVGLVSKNQESRLVWSVYRHTLPVFVPIDQYLPDLQNEDQEVGLSKFAHNIRIFIAKTQYKRDKFDLLKNLTLENFGYHENIPIILNIEQDLQCQRVRVSIASTEKSPHVLELVCSLDDIVDVKLTMAGPIDDSDDTSSDDTLLCENILKNADFKNLSKNFRTLIGILVKNKK